MLVRKKNTYNNISGQRDIRRKIYKRTNYISFVNHGNRIQSSHNSLIIDLAADGGWPPAANFTLAL